MSSEGAEEVEEHRGSWATEYRRGEVETETEVYRGREDKEHS